MISIFAH